MSLQRTENGLVRETVHLLVSKSPALGSEKGAAPEYGALVVKETTTGFSAHATDPYQVRGEGTARRLSR